MSSVLQTDPDSDADIAIAACVKEVPPRSFFLFAGAGSGKTRSLTTVLKVIQRDLREQLMRGGHRIAVVTYTNAASDVISQRLEFDPFIHVSTIHSFAWTLIGGYNDDIRKWLISKLTADIAELQIALAKSRPGTKIKVERESSLAEKAARLQQLDQIKVFTYSPTGENSGRDSLSHFEVIQILSSFLSKTALRAVLVGRFPYLFVDESQDTNKELIDGLFAVQAENRDKFCVGLFGDTMQRIYSDGKVGLAESVPPDWAKPEKRMNWRSPKRVVRLINAIRAPVDGLVQKSPDGKCEGFARCYIFPSDAQDKGVIEATVREKMALATGDSDWRKAEQCKALTLEHHMSANRLGFAAFFMPLYQNGGLRTGLINKQLSGISLILDAILPLVQALERGDEFEVARIVRMYSPLLQRRRSRGVGDEKRVGVSRAREAVRLLAKVATNREAIAMDILKAVSAGELFEIPESLRTVLRVAEAGFGTASIEAGNTVHGAVESWYEALQAPFEQVRLMADYLSESAQFDTHQGVKGREFPRVMVIMDPEEERGFMFNYDKLFEVSPRSKADLEREQNGEETQLDRTRRLFYVTCSRAENSLAVVIYTSQPELARTFFISKRWFANEEIEIDYGTYA